jgi:hypothetical protein
MCVICLLCLIVYPLPPGKTLFAVKINNNNIVHRLMMADELEEIWKEAAVT